MEATSTHAPWRYTCTFGHLDNLDTHHLKEHIAVTHLMRVKCRCLQCSLEVLTSDAMIHHRTWNIYRVALKALDKLKRFCDDAIQSEMKPLIVWLPAEVITSAKCFYISCLHKRTASAFVFSRSTTTTLIAYRLLH
ncbi:unnamed protein product, partial [Mesorhabditis belari]|uniref:Uncharacterized protein n=1 Tax=Mesorhabditis belari TaxID=2138241 RepID=A0AAF3J549_9BILA